MAEEQTNQAPEILEEQQAQLTTEVEAERPSQESAPAKTEELGEEYDETPATAYCNLDQPVMVKLDHVSKIYRLFKSDRQRLLSIFTKRAKFKTIKASDDLSFEIHKGDSVALIGLNGAGKSTALKMITGVTRPTSGTVEVNGEVGALLELRAGFDRQLTGRENLYMRAKLRGMSKEDTEKAVPKMIEFADLGDYIDQPMRTYSSGMRARLGFAYVVSISPEILVIDEALAVGDKRFKRKCRRVINKLLRTEGMTIIFVTHESKAAKEFCKRGIVLEKGKAVFDGPIEDAITFYNDRTA